MPYFTPKEVEEQFDEKFIHPFGANDLRIFTIPQITDNAKFWAIENITKDLKSHIHSLRQSDIQSHIEKLEGMRKKEIDGEDKVWAVHYLGYDEAVLDMQAYFESLLTK